ncbi:MAG: hypothetical protein IJV04_04890 [Lachnospiraceae bacterium]|nr:hypothetical protein [Lachnospiraceae bacterium]
MRGEMPRNACFKYDREVITVWPFIVGMLFGAIVAVFVYALIVACSEEDRDR